MSYLELLVAVVINVVDTLVVVGVDTLELDGLELVLLELTLEDVEDTELVVGVLTLDELELETLQAKTNQQISVSPLPSKKFEHLNN